MADAITTKNPVKAHFIVNKYDDIDGSRVNQETQRGRLCFRDTNGRMTLPRTWDEANKALFPVDWAKPLNPGPWFDGAGLNGATLYPFSDGSLNAQENTYAIDPDTAYSTPWPAAVKQYDVYPALYDLPITSGNKCLVYDEGTFTYASGLGFVGAVTQYNIGAAVYAEFGTGAEGKLTYTASGTANPVGFVVDKGVFGPDTITVKVKGTAGL